MAEPNPHFHRPLLIAVLGFCLALAGAASMTYYHLGVFVPRALAANAAHGLGNGYAFGSDFYPIWLAARLAGAGLRDPYSPEMTRRIQTGLYGRSLDAHNPADPPARYREFAYPAFTELLLWPSATLEFPKLRLVLAVLLPALAVATLWLWLGALQGLVCPLCFAVITLLGLCNYPVLEALFAEQPGLIVSFLLAASTLAFERNRLMLAGVLFSLTMMKPQMTLLACLYLLLWSVAERGRLRLLVGFAAATSLLLATSLWVWPHWIGEWAGIVLGYKAYATPPLVNLLLGGILGSKAGAAASVALLAVGLAVAWRFRRASCQSPEFGLTLSFLLAITSVVLLPGLAVYDHVILLPGIFLVLRYRESFGPQDGRREFCW
jgi:hypothetical protein